MAIRGVAAAAAAFGAAAAAVVRDQTLTVKSDGTGQFTSVQAALDSLQPGSNPSLGHVKLLLQGYFWERVHVYSNFTGGVSFVGLGAPDDALIAYNVSGSSGAGTFGSWTMKVEANDFTASSIAVANSADGYNKRVAAQSVALDIESDRVALYNVRLYGAQDTFYTGSGRIYCADCYVNGTVDAIFGHGATVFERATIRMNDTVTAHTGESSSPGGVPAYLFLDSDVDSIAGSNDLMLGRPWGAQAKVVFINTRMGAGVSPAGWEDWGHNCTTAPPVPNTTWCSTVLYAEYNSTGPGADPSARVWWSQQLTAAEAAVWTVPYVLGDWTPQPPTVAPVQPVVFAEPVQAYTMELVQRSTTGPRYPIVSGDWLSVAPGAKVCNVLNYGAKGDGVTDDTKALQAALTDCTTGGTVYFPAPYTFWTFGITATNVANLVLDVEGTIRFNNDTTNWPKDVSSCITVNSGGPLALTGGGLVDGNGAAWWPNPNGFRPPLLTTDGLSDILVTNLTFTDSPNHQLRLYSANQEVVDTVITAWPPCDPRDPVPNLPCAANTDGVDTHNTQAAWVHRCHISTGDDNVAIHGNNTLIEDNVFGWGHGTSIGSLGVDTMLQNITVRNSSYNNTWTAARIKSDPGATGYLRNVAYENLTMSNVLITIGITMFYPKPDPTKVTTLNITNIIFRNITSFDAVNAGTFDCDAHTPCTGVVVDTVLHTGKAPSAWQCENAYGITNDVTPALCLEPGWPNSTAVVAGRDRQLRGLLG